MKQLENSQQPDNGEIEVDLSSEEEQSVKKGRPYLFIFFIFLIVMGALGGGGFFGWQKFIQYQLQSQSALTEIKSQLAQRPTQAQIEDILSPLEKTVGQTDGRLSKLEQDQNGLQASTEKLYELYGRDENGWKLAEVEYLMSIAQHKLVLENDFEGAAKTLLAASERIGELADPGLLPVRVEINDEIARLKNRLRPDLVGMTLLISRLSRQIPVLKPGYQTIKTPEPVAASPSPGIEAPARSYDQRLMDFFSSLVNINTSKPKSKQVEQTAIINVKEKLEDNLKLTRWAVLERDAFQYKKLMAENVTLFRQYYDLENAANADFMGALEKLQKTSLKPDLPDIGGSLRLLREIQSKRENSPEPVVREEAENG